MTEWLHSLETWQLVGFCVVAFALFNDWGKVLLVVSGAWLLIAG